MLLPTFTPVPESDVYIDIKDGVGSGGGCPQLFLFQSSKGCFVVLVLTQRDVYLFLSSNKVMFICSCPHTKGCLVVLVLTQRDV